MTGRKPKIVIDLFCGAGGESQGIHDAFARQEQDIKPLLTPENCRIGFRMLTPRELQLAQSFPADYRFTGTKTDVVKHIGNAVCPKVAEALAI